MPIINFTKFFLTLLYIISLLVFTVSCEECAEGCTNFNNNESGCSNCDGCKFFYVDNTCIACDLSSSPENTYYTKISDSCSVVDVISGYKLLYNKYEVVSGNCPSTGDHNIQLGDICYKAAPANSRPKEGSTTNEYECQKSFSKETNNFVSYTCYSTDECPSGSSGFKYYFTTTEGNKECLNSCDDKKIKKENNIDRCSDNCLTDGTEFEYDETENDGTITHYCVTTCPGEAKYHYTGIDTSIPTSESTPIYKCLQKCDDEHFSKDGLCVTSCPNNYPYSYSPTGSTDSDNKNFCLKSCEDTNKVNNFFTQTKTYIYERTVGDNVVKSCEANQPTGENGLVYYKDEKSLKWVTDCKLSPSGPFHTSDSCKESCEGFYCINNDNLECISEGSQGDKKLYEVENGDNICYDRCPEYTGKGFYKETDKKCISCSVGDGYYRAEENKICYELSNFPNDKQYYMNEGDNFFFENGCNSPLYKYSKVETPLPNPIKCYQSCFNITGTKFEKDYKCYVEAPTDSDLNNYYFYKVKDDFTKYTKNSEDCLKFGFPYLKDDTKECIKECSDYRILPTQNELGKCCTSLDNCKNDIYKYYNDDSKICSDKCEGFIVVDNGGNLITTEQNCLESCPNTYCEDAKNKRCFKECNNYYVEKVEQSDKKIYTDKCEGFYYKESNAVNRCVEVCSKFDEETNIVYTYYVEGTKECIDTCPKDGTTTNSFSYDTKDTHQPCLSSCKSEEYYYSTTENPKICLKECNADDFYESSNSQICVKNCPGGSEYIHPGNICSSSKCPASAPFIYQITINVEGEDKFYKKCISNCKDTSCPLYKVSCPDGKEDNECLQTCEGGYIYNEGCYKNCTEGLYIKTESNNKNYCVTKCQKNYFKNSDGAYECIDGCNEDYRYLTSSGECVNECPINENFIGSNNKCLSSCEQDTNKFYELASNGKNYQCIPNCYSSQNNNKIYMEGTNLCINSCSYYLYEKGNDKICYETCISNENASFSAKNTNSVKVCSDVCLSDDEKNYYNDKICRNGCTISPNNTINNFDNSCVRSCDLTSEYKFLQRATNDENSALHCKRNCDTSLSTKRFLSSNYICIEICEIPNNYVVVDTNHAKANECLSKCPDDMPYMRKRDNGEYFCTNIECGSETDEFFYMDTKICMSSCGDSLYSYEKDSKKYCVNTCDFLPDEKRYSYETTEGSGTIKKCIPNCAGAGSKKYTKLNGMCDIDCDDSEFHVKDEFICMATCPYGTKNTEGKICEKCEELTTPQYIDENGNCIEDCANSNYKYHNKDEYQCLSSCDSSKFIEDNICKESCENENKLYMDNKICLEYCPINKRFFVDTENYTNKTCIYDCPDLYKYYTISGNFFSCTDVCSAYIPNTKMKAQLCLGTGCNETYPFFIKDQDNKKMCYSQCPSSKPYYYEEATNQNHCYEECPDNTIHLSGDYKCIPYSDCKSPYKIKYSIKQCVEQCSKNDLIFEKNNDNTFCLNRCDNITNDMKGRNDLLKLTYDNKCVFDCPSNSKEENNRCICTRLFYYNKSTGYKTCLNADLTLCETVTKYPIIKINQDECTDYCDGILSVSGFECYDNSYKCEKNETLTTLVNGDKKCECVNKYYYITENNRNIKKCLGEKDECPLSHQYLIKETKECVNTCPETKYSKKYGKTCVSECPSSTEEDNGECKCAEKWYISDNLNTICIKNEDECPSDKEIYVESTKQCVSSCIGTGSEVYYSKTCIGNCEGKDHTTITDSQIDPKMKLISTQYCKCNYLWYYDIDGNEVCKTREDTITCKNIDGYNFKYVIDLTKQCTNECPEQYPFLFGDKCISDCDDNQIKDDELKTCKCINSWKYNELNQIECLDSCDTDNLQIFSTRQCVTGPNCPPESPLFYQKVCYKPNECPKDSKYDEINQKCACKNKWYKDDLDLENCLTQNADCPGDYKYIDFETNECKKEKGLLYEVNNTLYHNCPINTIKDDTSMQCICDPLAGYWYEETKEGKKISVCGLERCEGDYQYNVYLQKQCFRQCDADLFSYQGICYDKCPNLTEIIPNTNECQLKAVDNEITINDLEKVMTDNIVDLYKKSETIDIGVSQKIVTKEATVEFYGVNKEKKGHTNQDVKSDLSYIDISECIEKIYKSNNMDEKKDDIVILKFDVNRELNNYLITPVEYKFINSRTGKSLDASVCEHNSIRISYPVHNLINRYDKMRAKLRMLEYMKIDLTSNNKDSLREKIDKGKEIIADYPDTDIFDINDKFYSDMCTSVKVNGKDLVIEDRINFFYPKLSLCETNCTYNHTDFINERIYCDCSYKTEFDVKRNYSDSFELNTIDITNNQKSSSNIEVMKCLSNLNKSKSLSKNGGFIYSLIIMILEAILAIVIIFIGINSLSLKLKNKIDKKDDNIEKIEVNVINDNNKKTYEDIKTSERNLDNPPKKKISDFKIEFIPQEYVFLFFSQGEKGIIKKVEKDSVPFKIQYNTRILLEQKKGVNYDNIKPRGPFPNGQNVLVVVDSMNDDINDYIGDDDDNEKNKNKNDIIDTSRNRSNNSSRKGSKKIDEKYNNKNSKINMYKKTIDQFTISDYDPSDENYSVYDVEEEIDEDEDGAAEHHEKGFIETLKKNQRLINRNYEIAMQNKNANFVEILFTEIVDKIYITKILFFTRKFDIFSLQLSVYLLCHLLLLVLNTLFYDINTIKKIWNEENYPGLGYHLGYGLLACLIIWVVYKIFLCLLTNNDKVKDLLKMIHYNNKFNWNKGNEINRKYKNLMWKVKFKFVIYSVIELLLIIFAFLYLTAFGSVYSGTQSNTFKTYGIALIEILIIKILYGTALAIMRHVSLSKQKKVLYDIVLFMNTYLV